MIEKRKLYKNINGELFFYCGSISPTSLIDKINELGYLSGRNTEITTITGSMVIIDKSMSSNFNFIAPHLGYGTDFDGGLLIWNKDNDPRELECRRPHIFKI